MGVVGIWFKSTAKSASRWRCCSVREAIVKVIHLRQVARAGEGCEAKQRRRSHSFHHLYLSLLDTYGTIDLSIPFLTSIDKCTLHLEPLPLALLSRYVLRTLVYQSLGSTPIFLWAQLRDRHLTTPSTPARGPVFSLSIWDKPRWRLLSHCALRCAPEPVH